MTKPLRPYPNRSGRAGLECPPRRVRLPRRLCRPGPVAGQFQRRPLGPPARGTAQKRLPPSSRCPPSKRLRNPAPRLGLRAESVWPPAASPWAASSSWVVALAGSGLSGRAMDVETAIRTRRTHKAFGPDPLTREQVEELLELARWAPNHHLTAPWRFRVLGPRAPGRLEGGAGPPGDPRAGCERRGGAPRLACPSASVSLACFPLAGLARRKNRRSARRLSRRPLTWTDADPARSPGGDRRQALRGGRGRRRHHRRWRRP